MQTQREQRNRFGQRLDWLVIDIILEVISLAVFALIN